MSKIQSKKLLKMLATATLGAIAGVGVASGCTGHNHTYADTYSSDAAGHWKNANCEHLDLRTEEGAHVDENGDGKCDVCDYVTVGAHTHAAAADVGWVKDATKHWKVCAEHADVKVSEAGHADADKNGKCDTCEYVLISLDKAELSLDKGAESTLAATLGEGVTGDVSWSTSDPTIATVEAGKVTALKGGSVIITATCGDKAVTCAVKVYTSVTFATQRPGVKVDGVKVCGEKVTKPTDPVAGGYNFGGWYLDTECTQAYDFDVVPTDNLTLYGKWVEHTHDWNTEISFNGKYHYYTCKLEGCKFHKDETLHSLDADGKCADCGVQVKNATFEFKPSELSAQAYAEEFKSGIFSVLADTTIRTRARENYDVFNLDGTIYATGFTASKSVQFSGTNRGMGIYAPAPGKLTIYLDNGSSGLTEADNQKIIFTNPDGVETTLEYPAKKLRCMELDIPTEGFYKLTRGANGTTDIYYAKFEAAVPVTPIQELKIANPGKTEYIVGEDFDFARLQTQLVYTITGMVEPLRVDDSHLAIDYTAFNKNTAGTYNIVVKYTDDKGNEFNVNYDVKVYDVEALELGFDKIVQGSDSFNQVFANVSVRQLYFVGDTFSTEGLTVKTVFGGGVKKNIVTAGFVVSAPDMTTAGVKEITVSWADSQTIVKKFNIYVMAKPVVAGETITASVSGAFTDAQVGTEESGAYKFKTIKQALDFLGALELDVNVNKVINLAAGTYTEKVEVNIPNLTMNGADLTDATKTVIEWDALFGETDPSGFTHTTDSTSTLNVRRDATGFTIKGVTISNKWNSTEYFDAQKGAKYNEHRALALLVQADKVVIEGCRLLGYQDTVEFFTGRQYVKNTYIQGRTDFIFGSNNTTLFEGCEIRSIVETGYITAFKGNNKDANDAVLYGAIFYRCRFTAPETVVAKKDTSIARPWGAYAAVAVVECEMGGHVTTTAYTGKAAGERYVTMSNNKPTDATVKFVEFGNTGAGAITEAQSGMKMLTAEEAANYHDLTKIFAKTNGGVTYTNAWNGSYGSRITEFNYKFKDHYTATDEWANGKHQSPAEGEAFFGDLATIKGSWAHELNQNKDQGKFMPGVEIRFNVAGVVTFTTYGGDYGKAENFKINYVNGKAVINVVATANSPIVNGAYLTLITLDKGQTGEHTHVYGAWNYTLAPTAAAVGSATKTCVDCELATAHSVTIELPVLSTDNYDAAPSATEGKVKYTLKTDATVSFDADPLPGMHVHNYSAWTTTATAAAAGKITKTCTSTVGTCPATTVEVNVPALNDAGYTITNNTAKLDVAGTGDYTIAVDGTTYTFNAPTPALTLTRVSESFTFNYVTGAEILNTANVIFDGCAKNNDWIIFGKGGSITLDLPEGATLKYTRSPYDAAAKIKINGVEQTGDKGAVVTYSVRVPGRVAITADDTAYFKKFEVEIDPNYEHNHTFGEWQITAPTADVVGSATRNCLVADCGKADPSETKELPVLSADNYNIAAGSVEGKSKFTLKSDTSISFEADALAGIHVHAWADNWTVTKPTDSATGTATKACTGTGTCPDGTKSVTLPVLTDSAYVITNNTATLEAAGTGTYTYTDATHGAISFTEVTPQVVLTMVESATTFNFGKKSQAGAVVEYVTSGGKLVSGLFINGTTSANGDWTKVTANTTVTIKIKAGLTVKFGVYTANNFEVYIGGTKLTPTSSNAGGIPTLEVTATEDTVYILKCVNADYIGYIEVTA